MSHYFSIDPKEIFYYVRNSEMAANHDVNYFLKDARIILEKIFPYLYLHITKAYYRSRLRSVNLA